MCSPASFIVTREKVLWLLNSDNHTDILKHFGISDYDESPDFVKIEISPKDKNYGSPLSQWMFTKIV